MVETKPKYRMVKEYILTRIQTGELKPDEKLESENQLAEKFEISRHTVRQAIGELTNENRLCRIQGKGTFVSTQTVQKGKLIGVMTTFLNDYIFPSIIRGIDEVLSHNGYSYLLNCTLNSYTKERRILENLIDKGIMGLIVEPVKSAMDNPNIDLYKQLMAKGVKILFIHGYYRNLQTAFIVQDDRKSGYLAAKNLLDNRLKKIGGIFKFNDLQGRQRYEGFVDAIEDCGHVWGQPDVLWLNSHKLSVEKGNVFGWDFLRDRKIIMPNDVLDEFMMNHDGLVIYNEQIAVTVMDDIKSKKLKIPNDISVVTFDDSYIATTYEPKITTISHPKNRLGTLAAEKLLFMIQNHTDAEIRIVLEPELIVRDSVRIFTER